MTRSFRFVGESKNHNPKDVSIAAGMESKYSPF